MSELIVVAVVALALVVVLGYLGRLFLETVKAVGERYERGLRVVEEQGMRHDRHIERLLETAFIRAGVPAHQAAPDRFTPSGASWKAAEEHERVLRENEGIASSDDLELEREKQEAFELARELFPEVPSQRGPVQPTPHSEREASPSHA